MNLVLDTHPLLFYLAGNHRALGRRGRRAFADAERERITLHIPSVVLVEISSLERTGRIRLAYAELREQLALRPGYRLEPFTPDDADAARSLAVLADPFDRMIAGTALRLGLPLLTRDAAIIDSKQVKTVW